MPVSRRRPPKWSYFVLAAAILLLIVVVFRAVIDGRGSGNDRNSNALRDAASCGNIHFKSRPTVLLTAYVEVGPDTSVRLALDVPNADVDSFEKLSDLPALTPGPPEGWDDSFLKDKALSEGISAGSPADFQHVLQDRNGTPYSRLVVIQKTPHPDTRIYINVGCG